MEVIIANSLLQRASPRKVCFLIRLRYVPLWRVIIFLYLIYIRDSAFRAREVRSLETWKCYVYC